AGHASGSPRYRIDEMNDVTQAENDERAPDYQLSIGSHMIGVDIDSGKRLVVPLDGDERFRSPLPRWNATDTDRLHLRPRFIDATLERRPEHGGAIIHLHSSPHRPPCRASSLLTAPRED